MKAGFISLGCAKNLVDTEVMLGIMQEHGIELTNEPAEADILIVNTCAFIQSAKEESITTVLGMADYKETGRCRSLIVAGCLGQRYGQQLLDEMPEANAIIGTGAWSRIMEVVEETLKGRRHYDPLNVPEEEGFRRAVLDPGLNTLHRAMNRRLRARLDPDLVERALSGIPLSKGEKVALLGSPDSMRELHRRVWMLSATEGGPWGI